MVAVALIELGMRYEDAVEMIRLLVYPSLFEFQVLQNCFN